MVFETPTRKVHRAKLGLLLAFTLHFCCDLQQKNLTMLRRMVTFIYRFFCNAYKAHTKFNSTTSRHQTELQIPNNPQPQITAKDYTSLNNLNPKMTETLLNSSRGMSQLTSCHLSLLKHPPCMQVPQNHKNSPTVYPVCTVSKLITLLSRADIVQRSAIQTKIFL